MTSTATEPPTAAPAVVPVLGAVDGVSLGVEGLVELLEEIGDVEELLLLADAE